MCFVNAAAVLFVCFLLLYLYIKNCHAYWQRRKAPYIKPKNLFFGQVGEILFNKIPLVNYYKNVYDELSPHKFGGIFNVLTPVIVLRDPELIKNICIKDFDYFMDRSLLGSKENDLLSMQLFNLKGEQWKILRMKLTPTFTSGKMKNMFCLMKDCARELPEMVDKLITVGESIDVIDTMARYGTDVICSCAFGLESNSQKNSDSILRNLGRNISKSNFQKSMITLLKMTFPKLIKIIGLNEFDNDLGEQLKTIITNTIKYREENNIVRNDFIDLLISLKKKEILSSKDNYNEEIKIEFTDNLLTAQCFVFFVGGFDTSTDVLSFALYELARHEDFQTRLFNEINDILSDDQELSYESLQKMTYLEQVIHETMRMYPITSSTSRICNKDYLLDDEVIIEKNTKVVIPVLGLHYDPQYYENPYEFNPENFSKEAIDRRPRYVHLPFGEGPRNCIGMRFGLMQVKLGVVTIIKNYTISLSPKMDGPLKYHKLRFSLVVPDGIWLTFNKRC